MQVTHRLLVLRGFLLNGPLELAGALRNQLPHLIVHLLLNLQLVGQDVCNSRLKLLHLLQLCVHQVLVLPLLRLDLFSHLVKQVLDGRELHFGLTLLRLKTIAKASH